jgi:type I site-specific restriction endonuclease
MMRRRLCSLFVVGRGTRLRPDLFGPGQDKQFFYVFDYCQNLEFFSQNPDVTEGATAASLGKRLFTALLALITELDKRPEHDAEKILRADTASRLREEVAAMNIDNFIVRPKRRRSLSQSGFVEKDRCGAAARVKRRGRRPPNGVAERG